MQAGEDSHPWLELLHRFLHLVGFAESHVRRIADHKIKIAKFRKAGPSTRTKVLARDDIVGVRGGSMAIRDNSGGFGEHRLKNITLQEPHTLIELHPGGIGTRDFQRLGRKIDGVDRSEEHTSELQSPCNLVCRLL